MRYARGAGTCPIRAESQCAPTSRDGRGRPRKAVSDEIVTSARSMLRPPVVRITRSPDAPGCSIDTSTVGAVADAGAAVGWTWTAVTPAGRAEPGARRRRECRIRSRPRRIRERAEVVGRADRLYQCRPRMRSVGVDQHPRTGPHSPEHHLLRQVQLAVDQYVAHTWTGQPDGDGVALGVRTDELPATGHRQVQAVEVGRVGCEQGSEAVEIRGRDRQLSDESVAVPALHRDQARVPQTSGRTARVVVRNAAPTSTESLSAAGRRRTVTVVPTPGVRQHRGEQFAAEMPGFDRVDGVAQALERDMGPLLVHRVGVDAATDGARPHDSTSVAGKDARGVAGGRRAPGRRVVRRRRRCVRHPPHRRRGARPMRRRRRASNRSAPTRAAGDGGKRTDQVVVHLGGRSAGDGGGLPWATMSIRRA